MRWHIPVIQPSGQGDEVGFLVTRINDEQEVAEGIIKNY